MKTLVLTLLNTTADVEDIFAVTARVPVKISILNFYLAAKFLSFDNSTDYRPLKDCRVHLTTTPFLYTSISTHQ
jgi:hypothetical protein